MHFLEDFGLLATDAQADFRAEFGEFGADLVERLAAHREVHDHHHVEITADDGLRDVENVDFLLCEVRAGLGDDAHGILADDGDDDFLHSGLYYTIIRHCRALDHHRSASIAANMLSFARFHPAAKKR